MSDEIEWHEPLPRNVPRQTYTPAIYALGITLLFWGLLTSWILCATGVALALTGVIGWTRALVRQAAHASPASSDERAHDINAEDRHGG